ncbi:hypothetical protein E0489_08325 [Thermus tengchongensis]|uniref:Transcriptional regulator n=1 Tax=Thermus tengchongensis TaxID=1214928 RepID=A0ABY2K7B4_9DEIN|nr:hypothetical protein E0489_08325 [Thermus tengchongensis]
MKGKEGNALKRPLNDPVYALPLFGRARVVFQGKELRVCRKGLALLYYLALEGPTSRARLADLLYGHGSALQNLRVELHRLSRALGREVFPKGQDPLSLPSWLKLETLGHGEVLEGLEEVEGLWEWVQEVRTRSEAFPGLPCRQELLRELSSLHPPFLLVLRGRLGAGQRQLAQELARVLGLAFHQSLRPEGLVYLEFPYPQVPLRELLRSKAFLVLSLDPGEEPRFFLELRANYPPERMRVLELSPLPWYEARQGLLAGYGFQQAARAYFLAGGQPEWIPEWLASAGCPQRLLAQLRLQSRWLSEPARVALERLSVALGPIPEQALDALGALPYLEELERKGWLVYGEGYRFAKEAERRLFSYTLPPGRRRELHERAATALALAGRNQEEALHRKALGEGYEGLLDPHLRQAVFGEGRVWEKRGLGRELALLLHENQGVFPSGQGFGLALLEPTDKAHLDFASLEEEAVLELLGEAYAPEDSWGLLLALRGAWGEGHLRLEGSFAHRLLLPPGPFRLRFSGLGVAEFSLRAYRPRSDEGTFRSGKAPVDVWVLAAKKAQEIPEQGEKKGKNQGRSDGNVHP